MKCAPRRVVEAAGHGDRRATMPPSHNELSATSSSSADAPVRRAAPGARARGRSRQASPRTCRVPAPRRSATRRRCSSARRFFERQRHMTGEHSAVLRIRLRVDAVRPAVAHEIAHEVTELVEPSGREALGPLRPGAVARALPLGRSEARCRSRRRTWRAPRTGRVAQGRCTPGWCDRRRCGSCRWSAARGSPIS